METVYINAVADHGGSLITHIALVDETGTEISGGSPAYARQAVTWTSASDGTINPNADLVFDVPPSTTIGGWRGYSASSGGTNYGGSDLTQETFSSQGEYTLVGAQTSIGHTSA